MLPNPLLSEPFLSTRFIEASPYCLFHYDLRQRRVTYISPNLERLWGYRVEDVLSAPDHWQTLIHPEDLSRFLGGITQSLQAKAVQTRILYRARHLVHGYRWVENIISFFYDEHDKPLDALCYILDITERKQAEDELRHSEDRLNRIFGASPAGIGLTSLAEGRFLYFNESALRMSGYTQAEIAGKTNAVLGFWLDRRSLAKLILSLRRGQPVLNYEHSVRIKSGETLHLLSSFDLIELEGKPYVVNISIDITARKHAEEVTQQVNQELTGLLEMGQLLANYVSLEDLLFSVVRSVLNIFKRADAVTIWLYHDQKDRVEAEAWTGFSDEAMTGLVTSARGGIVGSIFTTREPRIVDDYSTLPGHRLTGKPELDLVKSLVGVPLQSDGQVIGVLFAISNTATHVFGNDDVRLLQSLANQVALTIINRKLFDAEHSARHLAETLKTAYLAISKSLNLAVVLESLLEVLRELVPYDSADVELLHNGHQLVIVAAHGYENFSSVKFLGMTFELADFKLTKRMFDNKQSCLAADVVQFPEWVSLPESAHIRSWLGVPIIVQGQAIGLYSLDKVEPGFFTQEHLQLAELLAVPAAIAISNARLFEEVNTNREQLQLLTRRVYTAQEEERLRLSGELHDDLGAMLTPIKARLYKIPLQPSVNPVEIRAELDAAMNKIDDVSHHVRRLARDLRPPSIDAVGIGPVMAEYCRDYAKQTGLIITYESHASLPPLPGDFSIGLYRILQEALNNVVKHAKATRVDVSFELADGILTLIIADNGQGLNPEADPNRTRGIGMVGMQERVALLKGALTVTSRPNQGVRLQADLLMPAAIS
jgi:PAS domain S-box-containing protein